MKMEVRIFKSSQKIASKLIDYQLNGFLSCRDESFYRDDFGRTSKGDHESFRNSSPQSIAMTGQTKSMRENSLATTE